MEQHLDNTIIKEHPNDIFYLVDSFLQINYKLKEHQSNARIDILQNAITIISGNAGSGKTFCGLYTGVELYFHKSLQNRTNSIIKNLIICVPIPDNDELGFLRGTLSEKLEPRIAGIKKMLSNLMSIKDYKEINSNHNLQFYPLSHIRGLTFDDSFILIDEAQNLTITQIKLLISRIGKNSKMVFCGDETQIDLKNATDSGFPFFKQIAKDYKINGFINIEFEDNLRHPIIYNILSLF